MEIKKSLEEVVFTAGAVLVFSALSAIPFIFVGGNLVGAKIARDSALENQRRVLEALKNVNPTVEVWRVEKKFGSYLSGVLRLSENGNSYLVRVAPDYESSFKVFGRPIEEGKIYKVVKVKRN